MKVIVIDDEKNALILLEALLKELFPEITHIYTALDLKEGVELIHKHAPDIVFLDIEMPNYSGLQILDFFDSKQVNFNIIFVTAYNQYAVEAFKLSAVDYILKPININHLKAAVQRSKERKAQKEVGQQLEKLKKLTINRLPIEVPNGMIFLSYDEIQYLEADGSYTKIYVKNGNVKVISKTLKFFVDQLSNNDFFFKSHRSYLVNIKYVKEFVKNDGGYLLMKNDTRIPLAKANFDAFSDCVKELF
ncbi:LytTR family DNA-binding domain-containing protein [uncultured Tenacibaculum sp.]|uniref:LytR/AlgR family response regulator transcription factor n=1 Tax=uncultured Tenacibaculum sp. TaxID=174713 RepID=UPI00261CE7C1|nr:LytTR family DNA-binding domain-containing protein [uncultured Tenacibaculum sp.]